MSQMLHNQLMNIAALDIAIHNPARLMIVKALNDLDIESIVYSFPSLPS
jgi:hypothetical protein